MFILSTLITDITVKEIPLTPRETVIAKHRTTPNLIKKPVEVETVADSNSARSQAKHCKLSNKSSILRHLDMTAFKLSSTIAPML